MTIEAQHELSKISVDGECTYYSLKVPKGFDVKRLKNYEIHAGLTQYETGVEVNYVAGSGAHVILDPTSGRLGFEPISGEITVATYEPDKNKRFKFLDKAPVPSIEATKDRSQLALIGMSSGSSSIKIEENSSTKKEKKKKKKRKHDNSQIEPPVKIERI